jgi:hypothetical protein
VLLRGGGRGIGVTPQAAEYKGQQGIVNILNEKSGLSAFNKFYNNFYLVVLTVLLLYYSIFKQNKFQ